jgi:hypothetical protein
MSEPYGRNGKMIKINGCKKCHGALLLDKDEYGWYEECIQCGYTRDVPLDVSFNPPTETDAIPVRIKTGTGDLAEKWKQNKIPSFKPVKDSNGPEEDA